MTSTLLWLVCFAVTVYGLRYLWLEQRQDFWLALALFAGRRAGILVDMERERRRAALAGEELIDELGALALKEVRR